MTETEKQQPDEPVLTQSDRKELIINNLLIILNTCSAAVIGATAFAILTEVANERPEYLLNFILYNLAAMGVCGFSGYKALERMRR